MSSNVGLPEIKKKCRCNCGYTCGRKCGLPIEQCMDLHYRKDCDHDFNGSVVEFKYEGGSTGASVTCTKCDELAIDHGMAVGP